MIDSLYVHIPFCKSICYYCDFCHVVYNEKIADEYLDALEKDLNFHVKNRNLKTIYIGGGTPTCLNEEQLEKLLQMLRYFSRFVKEYTIEINPETMSEAKYQLLAKYGINRASIGLQSTNDDILKFMNRKHDFNDVKNVIDKLHQYHIDNISLDLMYSIPNQTLKDFKNSLNEVCKLDIDHVSIYSLTIEENTVFGKKGYTPLDEDTEADMYDMAKKILKQNGFKQYEISNFAKDGHESQHNIAYWNYDDYYGVGAGASGKQGYIRYDVTRNILDYIDDYETREEIHLSDEDLMFENVMMSLRMVQGLDLKLFAKRYDISFQRRYGDVVDDLVKQKLLVIEKDHVHCSEYGLDICNSVIEEFLAI